jgi:hypothetical protein
MRVTGITTQKATIIKHPPQVTILPIFLSLPLLVSGMPMDREIRDLAAEIPKNLFHENPPRFILFLLSNIDECLWPYSYYT